jgi:hypothetical protein
MSYLAKMNGADSEDGRQLYRRYCDAKGNWDNWRSIYDEAYAFAIPERDPWPQDTTEGRRKNIQVYDITAVNSARRLVSRLHSSLVPPGEQWFLLEAGDNIKDPSQKKQLNMYLQNFTDIIFQVLNDSNFDIAINELFQDLIIGTGGMMILESNDKKSPVRFKSVGIDVIYPEGDAYDDLNTIWRDFPNVYGRDIERMWPKARVTQAMQTKLEADPLAQFQLVEGVVYYPEKQDYRIVVMLQDTNEYLMDVRSKSSPWVVARWSKCSNEVGGRGPVIEALPTIRSLNALVEEIMRNVALSTSPPWMAASDGVFNPYLFQIEPNKVIPISRQSMGDVPLKRLDVSGDVNMGNLEVNDMRMQIKDALFDNPVRPVESPEQTATEVMIRQQQFMEEIGPAFGRLSVELLPKIINRVIFILQKKGFLPPELHIDNKNIAIRYKSPLVRSAATQKIQNLQNYVAIMQPIVGQELTLGSINVELLPQWLSDKLDVDETLIKSPLQVQQLIGKVMESQNPPQATQQLPSPNQQLAQRANAQTSGAMQANG